MRDPLASLAPPARDRRGGGRAALVAVLLVGALAIAAVVVLDHDAQDTRLLPAAVSADDGEPLPAAELPAPEDVSAADELEPVADLPPLGVAAGLDLLVPSEDAIVVSYHEASFPEALPIAPSGTLTLNENSTRAFDAGGPDGPEFRVQVSRGRIQGPTTAVDVVLPDGAPVLSPIAGTVSEVRPYELYGTHDDVRLELVPDDQPQLRVVLIHIEGVAVEQGDRVAVGDVLALGARRFPFHAVVDNATAPDRFGHVHIEVKEPVETPGDAASDQIDAGTTG